MFELDRKDQKQKRQKELVGPVWTLGSRIVLDQKKRYAATPLRSGFSCGESNGRSKHVPLQIDFNTSCLPVELSR